MGRSGPAHRVLRAVAGHYGVVLGSLLVLLAIYPFVHQRSWLTWLLNLGFLAVLVSCLLASLGRRGGRAVMIVAIVGELAGIGASFTGVPSLETVARILRVLVLFAAFLVVLRDVLSRQRVTMNTIFAAASVYLLMALVWSSVYVTLESLQPGSFALVSNDGAQTMSVDAQLLYFSLITLTTVGFGDITPNSPPASMLAALEGLIGQLFLAIILARLVAMELSARQARNEGEDP